MIISLADSCALWSSLIHQPELTMREPRIKQIAKMDLIGHASAQAIHQRQGEGSAGG